MPTSTLIALATSSVAYGWDSVTGVLFSGGIATFFILIAIICGVIYLVFRAIKSVFGM